MAIRAALNVFRRNRASSLLAGAAAAMLVLSLLSLTARANESHGNSAHNVSLSCPGTVEEGDTVTVTLTRGSDATKPIKGRLWTQTDTTKQPQDHDHVVVDINHNGNSKEVEIDTHEDSLMEGNEQFQVLFNNDHDGGTDASCTVVIDDDDDVEVESMAVTSEPESDETYALGETIQLTMEVDTNVTVANWAYVYIEIGPRRHTSGIYADWYRKAKYASGSGTDTIVYEYEVKGHDRDSDGIRIRGRHMLDGLIGVTHAGSNQSVTVGGYSETGNLSAHKVDGTPQITGIEITSEPDDGDAYRFREQIVFEMTLDADVRVHGTPGLKFTLGESVSGDQPTNTDVGAQVTAASRVRWAVYDSELTQDANGSSEGSTVIFVYDVSPTDKDTDGVSVPANDTNSSSEFEIPGRAADVDDDGNEIDVSIEAYHEFSRYASISREIYYQHDGLAADSDHAVDGTDPLIEIDFGTVNNALGATLTFWNIPNDDGDLTWRADITSDGNDQDSCEGANMGADNTVDEDDIPDLGTSLDRTVNLATGCTAGSYTMEVTATVDGEEVASASTSFQINLSWSPGD